MAAEGVHRLDAAAESKYLVIVRINVVGSAEPEIAGICSDYLGQAFHALSMMLSKSYFDRQLSSP